MLRMKQTAYFVFLYMKACDYLIYLLSYYISCVVLGKNEKTQRWSVWFIKAGWIRWYATIGQVLFWFTSGAKAVEKLFSSWWKSARDRKRTCQPLAHIFAHVETFLQGNSCLVWSEQLHYNDTDWVRAWLVLEVDLNWHPHTLNPPACCLQNVSFSSRAEIQTEMLWKITVSESVLGTCFLGKFVCAAVDVKHG